MEDSIIPSYDEAAAGDVVAIFADLKNYVINSNMEMTVTEWLDNDENLKKTKAMLICDGKLIDPNGVIIIKKGGASGG